VEINLSGSLSGVASGQAASIGNRNRELLAKLVDGDANRAELVCPIILDACREVVLCKLSKRDDCLPSATTDQRASGRRARRALAHFSQRTDVGFLLSSFVQLDPEYRDWFVAGFRTRFLFEQFEKLAHTLRAHYL
jgi:hypothetical protein